MRLGLLRGLAGHCLISRNPPGTELKQLAQDSSSENFITQVGVWMQVESTEICRGANDKLVKKQIEGENKFT